MRSLPGYEDLGIMVSEDGSTCGCGPMRAICEEGKHLEEAVAVRYRNCAGLYGRRVRDEARARWQEACKAYEQHCKDNHRD